MAGVVVHGSSLVLEFVLFPLLQRQGVYARVSVSLSPVSVSVCVSGRRLGQVQTVHISLEVETNRVGFLFCLLLLPFCLFCFVSLLRLKFCLPDRRAGVISLGVWRPVFLFVFVLFFVLFFVFFSSSSSHWRD